MFNKNKFTYIFLFIIVSVSFFFRLKGINTNHSFWSDEAFISDISKDVIFGKQTLLDGLRQSSYQSLHIFITVSSFFVFGISELSARFPLVLFNTIGIVFAYLIASKMSNLHGGLLSAFLFGFSQINLANSTQAKPYTALQTILLIVLYLLLSISESKNNNNMTKLSKLGLIFLFNLFATIYHTLGVLFWIPLITYFVCQIKNRYIQFFLIITIFLSGLIVSKFNLFTSNHFIFAKNLFLKQYGIFIVPALLGIVLSLKRYKSQMIGMTVYLAFLSYLWTFHHYTHNLRYLLTLFGLLFIFFGVFWSKIGELFSFKFQSASWLTNFKFLPLFILIVIYVSGYKIVRTPQNYYSPNLDFYGDVQNADYKSMYAWIEKKYGKDLDKIALFNDLIDTERFYLNRESNAYFMKGIIKPYLHSINKVMIYGTLDDFVKQKSLYKKGVLIIEDWDSYLPEDIKQYAKKNMKLELRIEKMAVGGERDIWPLEVRSWGFN